MPTFISIVDTPKHRKCALRNSEKSKRPPSQALEQVAAGVSDTDVMDDALAGLSGEQHDEACQVLAVVKDRLLGMTGNGHANGSANGAAATDAQPLRIGT